MKTILESKTKFMKLIIIEFKNNEKRKFEIEKEYNQARKYLIRLYHSNKIIYCIDILDNFLSYDDREELEFWQYRKIQKLINQGYKFERTKNE